GAARRGPLRHARQATSGSVDRSRTAGALERRRRVRERDVLGIRVRHGAAQRESAADIDVAVELGAANAHLLGVREIAARDAELRVRDLRLEVVYDRVEEGEVGR